MKKLRLPGVHESPQELSARISQALGGGTVRGEVRIEASRATEAGVELEIDETQDVLELEFEGGARQFIRFDQFVKDYGLQPQRGGEVLELPVRLSRADRQQVSAYGTATRGWPADLVLQAFRIVRVPLEERAALTVAKHFEGRLEPGLRRWERKPRADSKRGTESESPNEAQWKPVPLGPREQIPVDKPLLLFLHGTASSTVGSFGGLPDKQLDIWDRLHDTYPDRVLAFEHPTLSKSPIENVIDLLEVLPRGVRLHVVSHSRGGMLGELLCRGRVVRGDNRPDVPFDDLELQQFDGTGYETQRDALRRLNELLQAKQPNVERFVRVACPAAGTVLASDRLDTYFSVLVNVLGWVTGLEASFTYDFLTSLALATARERTNPTTLPGIEAMVPGSPLVKILNRPGIEVQGDLSVIAGDIEGAGLWQRLKVLATDLFYWQDHDLVVHTKAMYGGAKRTSGARYFFDKGPHVSHFNYFRNRGSADRLLAGLLRDDGDLGGFRDLVPGAEPTLERVRGPESVSVGTRVSAAKGVIFVLPGIMGSELAAGGQRIWLNMVQLATGAIDRLAIDKRDVAATGVLGRAYGRLLQHLSARYEVIPFPYDWRRSLLEESRRFGTVMQARLQSLTPQRPVHIVAHSMGGLLVRAWIAQCEPDWKQLKETGGRVVLLGTPNGGSHAIGNVLIGRDALVRNLARLDFVHDQRGLLDVVRRFLGLLELLPFEKCEFDYFQADAWQKLHEAAGEDWHPPAETDLKSARELGELLRDPRTVDPECMYYLAGKAAATPCRLRVDPEAEGQDRIVVEATPEGDGRVPWSTGLLPGVKAWYVAAEHGDLANHPPAFPAIEELLDQGGTNRLPSNPPVARGSTSTFVLPRVQLPVFPDEGSLENAALGSREGPESEPPRTIQVRITHGDLRYARHPVVVGHYQNDSIVGAERALDQALQGKLQARRQLGLYSGAVETTTVVLDENAKPPGAIVVGLGQVGGLTAGDLRRTIARGLAGYALERSERKPGADSKQRAEYQGLSVSLLLVGSGEGGVTIRDAVVAILEGAREANRALQRELPDRVGIAEIELLELDLARAVRASRVLEKMGRDPSFKGRFDLGNWRVTEGNGGQREIAAEDDPAWWTRLQITEPDGDGALQFVTLTERARAESFLLPTQRASLDALLMDAVRSTQSNDTLAKTLFELLIPNKLKNEARRDRRLILIVDKRSARYPWELLQDGADPDSEPLSVRAGMIRQLQTWTFREHSVMAARERALVVGDPPTTNFVSLDGARQEAEAVSHLMTRHGFEVEAIIRQDFRVVLEKLFAQQYRVLHLAGHGVYEYVPDGSPGDASRSEGHARRSEDPAMWPTVTGMVLADNVFLTPALIEQMRVVPELVFINCCHLGREEGRDRNAAHASFHRLAANLGTQLIEMGARAVICAGWAVDDGPAETFANEFYTRMLGGTAFGDAVRDARHATWKSQKSSNTWGAYQCYGDPDYRLVQHRGSSQPSPKARGEKDGAPPAPESPYIFCVVDEVVFALENISQQARTAPESGVEGFRSKIAAIVSVCDPDWRRKPRFLEALGRAYGEVGMFEQAAEYYQQARQAEDANFSIKTVEQAANFNIRWAAERWMAASRTIQAGKVNLDRAKVAAQTRTAVLNAVQDLQLLLELGKTKERFSLLGGAYKRLALISEGKARDEVLAQMQNQYELAHQLALKRDKRTDFYPALNWLTARILIALRSTRARTSGKERRGLVEVEHWLDRVTEDIRGLPADTANFFAAIALIDAELLRHFVRGNSDQSIEGLAQRYRDQMWLATRRQWNSVLEHLDFLAEILDGDLPAKQTAAHRLRQQLAIRVRELSAALKPPRDDAAHKLTACSATSGREMR